MAPVFYGFSKPLLQAREIGDGVQKPPVMPGDGVCEKVAEKRKTLHGILSSRARMVYGAAQLRSMAFIGGAPAKMSLKGSGELSHVVQEARDITPVPGAERLGKPASQFRHAQQVFR